MRFALFNLCLALLLGVAPACAQDDPLHLGPLFDTFGLTLEPGKRSEAVGPFYYSQQRDTETSFGVPPLFARVEDPAVESLEFDIVYPIISYDRFGKEYRFHIFQLIAWAGGMDQGETNVHRFNLFPFYAHQWSDNPERDYFAIWPFYGNMKNRLFRDEIDFVMWPFYVKTRRREGSSGVPDKDFQALGYQFARSRKGGVITYNYFTPFVHFRYGEGLEGWQFWPFVGHEKKTVTTRTNDWGDAVSSPGHENRFVMWPFYLEFWADIGTENPTHAQALVPFYSKERSPQRDSTTYFWPLGVTITDDRARKYHEVGAPWPLIVYAEGEGKHTRRIWPFFSQAWNNELRSDFYLWPVVKYNRFESFPLLRTRTRILFFGASKTVEKNMETGQARRRTDVWPLFSYRQDFDGSSRFQMLVITETVLPVSKSMDRSYSPLWSIWRAEHNIKTEARSQSFFWNLYRRETTPDSKKVSLLFGLFQYHSSPAGSRTKLFFVPVGGKLVVLPKESAKPNTPAN
jgi:hypothetical protein